MNSGNQSGGTSETFTVQLETRNLNTASPFPAANITITVEPDVRAIFSGTAVDISDRTGDNAQDGYLFTDYRTADFG